MAVADRSVLVPVDGQRARFDLADRRRKLLDLYFSEKIDAEPFSDEEERLANEIRASATRTRLLARKRLAAEVSRRFDQVLAASSAS